MKNLLKNKVALFALAVLATIATFILATNPVTGLAMLAAFPMIVKIGTKEFTIKTQEEKDQFDELEKLISAITEKSIAGFITTDEAIKAIEKKIDEKGFKIDDNEEFKNVQTAVIEHGKKINALMEGTSNTSNKSLGRQVAEYITANKAKFEDVVKTEGKIGFEVKVAASMLNSTHVTGTVPPAQTEPGITNYMAEQRFIMDVIGTVPIASPSYEWLEKKNPDGTVAFVLDTEAFANIDFDLDMNSMTAKDVGAYITVHENLLQDVDALAAEIDRELVYQIRKAADGEILSGVGTTSHLKGITEYASAFSLTSISIASPNTWDAVSAAIRQVELVGYDVADCIFMNPADYENALGSKDSNGRYVSHPSLSPDGTRFAGIPISTTSFITAGKLLVGNRMKSNIKVYKDVEMAMGYNLTGEFTKRHITVRGGMRLIHFIKDNHANSWVYDDITDIVAAITKEEA